MQQNAVAACTCQRCSSPLLFARLATQALYDACPGWGWSEAKKRAELADPQARFMVVFSEEQGEQPAQLTQQAQQHDAAQPPPGGQENQAAAGNGGRQGSGSCGAEAARAAEPAAFLHFRFEEEEGEAVLYCYEVQVAAALQVGWTRSGPCLWSGWLSLIWNCSGVSKVVQCAAQGLPPLL